jgi:hypothetical protein
MEILATQTLTLILENKETLFKIEPGRKRMEFSEAIKYFLIKQYLCLL